jgi:hypothetical protein
MPKAEKGTPKDIANKIKAKGKRFNSFFLLFYGRIFTSYHSCRPTKAQVLLPNVFQAVP